MGRTRSRRMDYIEELKRILNPNVATASALVPLDDSLIARMEARAGGRFPADYRAFLRTMGGGAGRFWFECLAFYPQVMNNTQELLEVLEGTHLVLPENAFVFYNRYFNRAAWFLLDTEPSAVDFLALDRKGGEYESRGLTFAEFAIQRAREAAETAEPGFWDRYWDERERQQRERDTRPPQ